MAHTLYVLHYDTPEQADQTSMYEDKNDAREAMTEVVYEFDDVTNVRVTKLTGSEAEAWSWNESELRWEQR